MRRDVCPDTILIQSIRAYVGRAQTIALRGWVKFHHRLAWIQTRETWRLLAGPVPIYGPFLRGGAPKRIAYLFAYMDTSGPKIAIGRPARYAPPRYAARGLRALARARRFPTA